MNKIKKYKIGDHVKTVGAIVGHGIIYNITKGGDLIGFPWKDDTHHYIFIDINTGVVICAHPNNLEFYKKSKIL